MGERDDDDDDADAESDDDTDTDARGRKKRREESDDAGARARANGEATRGDDGGDANATKDGRRKTTKVKATKEKLLVLDLNGLFIDRLMKRYLRVGRTEGSDGGETATKKRARGDDADDDADDDDLVAPREGDEAGTVDDNDAMKANEVVEDARVGSFYVYERPHMREFIEWAHERFEVAIWSSATERNTKKLVEHVWGANLHKVAFIWGQERCSNIGVAPSSSQNRPMFLKELQHVWKLKKKTGLSRFNVSNTLLIDDSPYKAIRNPEFTAIHPRGFSVEDIEHDDVLGENGALRKYLERVSAAPSVPEFVRANPWTTAELSVEQAQQIAHAKEACALARAKEKAVLDALRDPDEIVLDELF